MESKQEPKIPIKSTSTYTSLLPELKKIIGEYLIKDSAHFDFYAKLTARQKYVFLSAIIHLDIKPKLRNQLKLNKYEQERNHYEHRWDHGDPLALARRPFDFSLMPGNLCFLVFEYFCGTALGVVCATPCFIFGSILALPFSFCGLFADGARYVGNKAEISYLTYQSDQEKEQNIIEFNSLDLSGPKRHAPVNHQMR